MQKARGRRCPAGLGGRAEGAVRRAGRLPPCHIVRACWLSVGGRIPGVSEAKSARRTNRAAATRGATACCIVGATAADPLQVSSRPPRLSENRLVAGQARSTPKKCPVTGTGQRWLAWDRGCGPRPGESGQCHSGNHDRTAQGRGHRMHGASMSTRINHRAKQGPRDDDTRPGTRYRRRRDRTCGSTTRGRR